jgi:hypothetical protein
MEFRKAYSELIPKAQINRREQLLDVLRSAIAGPAVAGPAVAVTNTQLTELLLELLDDVDGKQENPVVTQIALNYNATEGSGICDREYRVNLLKLVAPHFDYSTLERSGFGSGLNKRVYYTSVEAAEATGCYQENREGPSGGGRKRACSEGELMDQWKNRAVPVADSESYMLRQPKTHVAEDIADELGCSYKTVLRGMPNNVVEFRRKSDVCGICESGRSCRGKIMTACGQTTGELEGTASTNFPLFSFDSTISVDVTPFPSQITPFPS